VDGYRLDVVVLVVLVVFVVLVVVVLIVLFALVIVVTIVLVYRFGADNSAISRFSSVIFIHLNLCPFMWLLTVHALYILAQFDFRFSHVHLLFFEHVLSFERSFLLHNIFDSNDM
jgi:hypothetical protein